MEYDKNKKSYECNSLWKLILTAGLISKIDDRTCFWNQWYLTYEYLSLSSSTKVIYNNYKSYNNSYVTSVKSGIRRDKEW